ncbi:unnamed protein product [Phytophthora lilii]|uniref:Unnamed protein product n=1 Tax=Phytophthora lilii TaxID=2077276 RepID=A0A9W6TEC1_9STRA|nr:unnamed protein product [Phytophthora lilii]
MVRTESCWCQLGHSPVFLAVGAIDGSLSEVMFGLETPDFAAMQVRSEVLANRPLEGSVLAQLAGPTEADPFQFMGVTWMLEERSWPLNVVVRARDFVVVSATGVITHTSGERLGYEFIQSIDLPQCPPLPNPIVRGKLMNGTLYRQQDEGSVDVYNQMSGKTQHHVLDKLPVDLSLGY